MATLLCDIQAGELRGYAATARHIRRGMYRDRQIAGKTYSHIARGGMEKRIGETAIANEFHRYRPRSSFYLRPAAQPEQRHAAAARSDLHRTCSAAQAHATAFGLSLNSAIDITQIQVAPAAHYVQITQAFLHLNAAGAGLDRRGPRRSDIHTAAPQVDLCQPAHVRHANIRHRW